jgi:hypothetical protein
VEVRAFPRAHAVPSRNLPVIPQRAQHLRQDS